MKFIFFATCLLFIVSPKPKSKPLTEDSFKIVIIEGCEYIFYENDSKAILIPKYNCNDLPRKINKMQF